MYACGPWKVLEFCFMNTVGTLFKGKPFVVKDSTSVVFPAAIRRQQDWIGGWLIDWLIDIATNLSSLIHTLGSVSCFVMQNADWPPLVRPASSSSPPTAAADGPVIGKQIGDDHHVSSSLLWTGSAVVVVIWWSSGCSLRSFKQALFLASIPAHVVSTTRLSWILFLFYFFLKMEIYSPNSGSKRQGFCGLPKIPKFRVFTVHDPKSREIGHGGCRKSPEFVGVFVKHQVLEWNR